MKAAISLILALCLCLSVFALAACGRRDNEALAGGWTVNSEFGGSAIPEEAQDAFDKAVKDYNSEKLTAVAYLGSQVVAGTNYAFLCTSSSTLTGSVNNLSAVTVYRALDGSAKLLGVVKLNLSAYNKNKKDVDFDPADIAGGWYVGEAAGAALPENAQTAFDKATSALLGVNYTPLALLGTQVVAGTNYAILCRASTVTAEPASALAVLIVYADLQGNAEVTRISQFDI